MGASLSRVTSCCLAALALSAGCGDINDDLTAPPDAAAGSSGVGASGSHTGGGSGGTDTAGGSSGTSGGSAAGGSAGDSGSGGTGASSGTAGTNPGGGAADGGEPDGSADSGDGGTDGGFCQPCPKTAPSSGTPCSPCSRPTACTYNACNESSNAILIATCSSETWSVKSEACSSFQCGPPPGGRRCDANQICVVPFYTCVDNPCQGEPFSCSCAQAACPGASYRCQIQAEPRTIYCNCLTC